MGYWRVSLPEELLSSAAHDRNAAVNHNKKKLPNIFKVEAVRGTTETRQKRCKYQG